MIQTIALVAVAVAVLFAVLALDRRRRWLVTLPLAVVVTVVLMTLLGVELAADGTWMQLALGIGLGVIGVLGGSPVVALVLRFAQGGVALGAHGGIVVESDTDDDDKPKRKGKGKPAPTDREVLRGGATIGYLERFALVGAVAAGQASAVAIIIAIKGLGRFSELDGSEARERFIIGTLTSFSWAAACAVAAVLIR